MKTLRGPIVILTQFLGLLLAGCASLTEFKRPAIELDSISIKDPGLTAATFVFGLRVDNPNAVRLNVRRLSYDLNLNQVEFASGDLEKLGTVPGRDKKVLEVPIRISYDKLFQSAYAAAESKRVDYRLKGKVQVSGHEVPFQLNGKLPFAVPKGSGD